MLYFAAEKIGPKYELQVFAVMPRVGDVRDSR